MSSVIKPKNLEQLGPPGPLTRSAARSSLRASFRNSKMKIDEFLRSPSFDFRLKRKRYDVEAAREDSESMDSVSLEEPTKKRRSTMAKVASFLTPMKSMRKVSDAFQKSLSVRNLYSPAPPQPQPHVSTPYRRPAAYGTMSPRRRVSMSYWHETVDRTGVSQLNKTQLDRQEAIFELYKSEMDLIDDLLMIKTTYHESMRKLGLMTSEELDQIFGQLYQLQPLHEDLVSLLRDQRLPDGTTDNVGQLLLDWVPKLESYVSYCANQVYVRSLLDSKKQDPAIEDFLLRCQESPFSRRLDIWSFIDVPRSRLVKYPLLFKNIQKHTSVNHVDHSLLDEAVAVVEAVIADVDRKTGLSKCQFTVSRLDFIDDKQRHPLIEQSQFILCDGLLKTSRGIKLHVFLFDNIFVMTRDITTGDQQRYQVYRQPIANYDLRVHDHVPTGPTRKGSFRNAFTQTQTVNNSFGVASVSVASQTYTLIANEELDKRHWLQQLNAAVASSAQHSRCQEPTLTGTACRQRRQSSRLQRDSYGSTGGGGGDDADTSFVSLNSCSSLMSVFSSNSTSTAASEYSQTIRRRNNSKTNSRIKDGDTDSGIVT